MKYLDTGDRDPQNSLAHWLSIALDDDVSEVRIQSGFFSIDGLGPFVPTLTRCRQDDLIVNIAIGANDLSTLKDDVAELLNLVGTPRNSARVGVVSFSGAYFHPKTYHFRRFDGSQSAFVGSANLSAAGLALHVEAGLVLDTRDGDEPELLNQIASAIDRWFADEREGITLLEGHQTIDALVRAGVIALAPPPREAQRGGNEGAGERSPRPRLRPLIRLPRLNRGGQRGQEEETEVQSPEVVHGEVLPSVPRVGFPPYLLFEPNSGSPTVGAAALSGALLPGQARGIIVQLNRDSARHFEGRSGTANISIPVATVSTLRFGIGGKHGRPAAKFDLHIRYLGDDFSIIGETSQTSLMGYGFIEGESGHSDIRLVVTVSARRLGEAIDQEGHIKPEVGDLAMLEWPTPEDPAFRLTFPDPQSQLFIHLRDEFAQAETVERLVGHGACWLPRGLCPQW